VLCAACSVTDLAMGNEVEIERTVAWAKSGIQAHFSRNFLLTLRLLENFLACVGRSLMDLSPARVVAEELAGESGASTASDDDVAVIDVGVKLSSLCAISDRGMPSAGAAAEACVGGWSPVSASADSLSASGAIATSCL
jgi:hypothetical protein